jgi:sporadic carbohydrate cluster 2OG-Fe(II) oxygenase
MTDTFLNPTDTALGDRFLADGYVILPVEDRDALLRIRGLLVRLAAGKLGVPAPTDEAVFLDGIGGSVGAAALNDFRLAVIRGMNAESWFRPAYYRLAAGALATLVGNELAMQRRINLSIQLPGDADSLLPVHADVMSGDSPFEVVVWLPLVDCFATKSMYLLPPEPNAQIQARLAEFQGKSAEDLFKAIESNVRFLDVPFGHVLLFSQNLLHGNRVNREKTTRWSMNCRFKGVFTPYADKKLGEFFEPITLKPATRMGLDYRLPGGFGDDA